MTILRSCQRLAVALLDRGDLGYTACVSFLGRIARGDEYADEIVSEGRTNDPRAKHEDIHATRGCGVPGQN